MSKGARKARREDSFSLSMVDLFGCGFIAAIFLFILNLLQPQIEAAAMGAGRSSGGAGRVGQGMTGPVFISVRSDVPIQFLSWPWRGREPLPATEYAGTGNDRFKHTYDQVLPDAAALRWPLQLDFCAKRDPAEKDCGFPSAPDSRFNLVVRVVLGYSTITAYFVQHSVSERINVSFDARRSLSVKSRQEFEHRVDMELRPNRRDPTSFHSVSAFFSTEPFAAAAGWAGGVERVWASTKDRERGVVETPSTAARCWAFGTSIQSRGGIRLVCPTDTKRLTAAVGDGSWRSEVFAQPLSACFFPFDENGCKRAAAGTPPLVQIPSPWPGPEPYTSTAAQVCIDVSCQEPQLERRR